VGETRLAYLAEGAKEQGLSWLDRSVVDDVGTDGRTVLFTEQGAGGGPEGSVFLKRLDDATPVPLGEGAGLSLSVDGSWALVLSQSSPPRLRLVPTGAGEQRLLDTSGLAWVGAGRLLPGGTTAVILGAEQATHYRLFLVDLAGGKPRAVSPEVRFRFFAVAPDGKAVVVNDAENRLTLFPLDGGAPRVLPGLPPGVMAIQWSADGGSLLVTALDELPFRLDLYDLASGKKSLWKEVTPADPTGVISTVSAVVSRDLKVLAYSYERAVVSDLYVVDGVR
jgi:hypothetical protein